MQKLNIKICMVILTLFALTAVAMPQAYAISLNQRVVVYDNVIKAGDLFEGLTNVRQNDRVLGAAPQPGEEVTINTRSLLRVAMAMDINWRPVSHAEYVVVERAAETISRESIKAALQEYLANKNQSDEFSVILDANVGDIYLPYGTSTELSVLELNHSPASRRFNSRLSIGEETYNISGSINRMVEIPVLRSALRNGDVIAANDIEYVQISDTNMRGNTVLNVKDLIGKTPRQNLLAGKPIKLNAIETPLSVKRGNLVTMIFTQGPLLLSAQGKALQNGSVGDTVRVVNTASKKTIEGIVTGAGEIKVMTF